MMVRPGAYELYGPTYIDSTQHPTAEILMREAAVKWVKENIRLPF